MLLKKNDVADIGLLKTQLEAKKAVINMCFKKTQEN